MRLLARGRDAVEPVAVIAPWGQLFRIDAEVHDRLACLGRLLPRRRLRRAPDVRPRVVTAVDVPLVIVAGDLNAVLKQVGPARLVRPLAPLVAGGADRPTTRHAPATQGQGAGKKKLCEHGSLR